MKAIICTKYGSPDVLQLREVETPTPKENEVLIKVHTATVSTADCEIRGLKFPLELRLLVRIGFGFRGPRRKILGQELAGDVEEVGREVTRFRKGDQVFAWTGFRLGAHAEYACLREDKVLAIKPSTLSYEEAAALPLGGLEATHSLRKGKIESGEKVLINGAGGSIGTFAVQIAKYYGADVTGVDSSGKLDMLRSIGADHVIDYTLEDFTMSGATYDVIFDTVGKSPYSRSVRALTRKGRYLLANPRLSQLVRARWTSMRGSKKVLPWSPWKIQDINLLKELVEAGKIKSVIDRLYPLEQTAEAHRYVDTGRKKGNVIITV